MGTAVIRRSLFGVNKYHCFVYQLFFNVTGSGKPSCCILLSCLPPCVVSIMSLHCLLAGCSLKPDTTISHQAPLIQFRDSTLWWELTTSFGRSQLKQYAGMSCGLIWWRAITWEGTVAFEVEAYPPHPAALQMSPWTHPKMCEDSHFSLRSFPWHTVWRDLTGREHRWKKWPKG